MRAGIVEILELPQHPLSLSGRLDSCKSVSTSLVDGIVGARVRPEGREEEDCCMSESEPMDKCTSCMHKYIARGDPKGAKQLTDAIAIRRVQPKDVSPGGVSM